MASIAETTTSMNQSGHLIPLRTTIELRPGDAMIEVYITRVPIKAANGVLNTMKSLYANTTHVDLHHLRKFSKAQNLPVHVMSAFGITPPKSESEVENIVTQNKHALYLLVGPTKGLTPLDLALHLEKVAPDCGPGKAMISTQIVPLLAPTSIEQATEWSKKYWPAVYKKSNPFGPHPSIIDRAQLEIGADVPGWMNIASKLGEGAKAAKIGEPIAAVIVDRSSGTPKIVSLAADARWKDHGHDHARKGPGNIMAHAALRAIGIVAQKMKAKGDKYAARRNPVRDSHEREVFGDTPLLPAELEVYTDDNISPDGYLCHGLEIYLTHEPCIMCSMAILHSRFAKVTFGQRMPRTGGMSSEGEDESEEGLGYGLFWRKELNWSLLAWEFKHQDFNQELKISELTHA